MRKMVIAAVGIPVVAALAFGCYEMSKQKTDTAYSNQSTLSTPPSSLQSPSPALSQGSMPGQAAPGSLTPNQPMAGQMSPAQGVGSAQGPNGVQGANPMLAPGGSSQRSVTTTTLTPPAQSVTLYSQQAVPGTPRVVTEQTTTVEKTTTVEPGKRVYVTRRVFVSKHHRSDKVHVARATKHGAMFALKLPGRLAF
jgi:hypothetical protein